MKKKILLVIPICIFLFLIIFLISFTKGMGLSAQIFINPYKEAKVGDWFVMTGEQGIITKTSCIGREGNTVTIQTKTFLGDERAFLSEETRDVETGNIIKARMTNQQTGEITEIMPPTSDPPQSEYLGTGKIKVKAGEFECEHYRINNTSGRTIDVWISASDDLPFPLMVKIMMDATTIRELVDYGKSNNLSLSNNGKDLEIKESALLENFPNPVKDSCWIPFQLAESSEQVVVEIYNILGQKVKTIDVGPRKAKLYTQAREGSAIFWDGKNERGEDVANGLYSYQIKTDKFSSIKQMVISR